MTNKIKGQNWSSTFQDLLTSDSKSLDIQQYDFCLNEWKNAHDSKMVKYYLLTIIFFCAGLWAVWESAFFAAVLLLALAANFNRRSSHHILISELMTSQRLIAMLINKQSLEIESLRNQITGRIVAREK